MAIQILKAGDLAVVGGVRYRILHFAVASGNSYLNAYAAVPDTAFGRLFSIVFPFFYQQVFMRASRWEFRWNPFAVDGEFFTKLSLTHWLGRFCRFVEQNSRHLDYCEVHGF